MGATKTAIFILTSLGLCITAQPLSAQTQLDDRRAHHPIASEAQLANSAAEASYFSRTLALTLDLRPTRLISADSFSTKTGDEAVVILDTRSADAYAASHLNGAISLPLTEMTELSLAQTLPSRSVPVLIYTDQNFGPIPGPIVHDSSDLSLGLLSFLALHQYGYTNVYELAERVAMNDARFDWKTTREADFEASLSGGAVSFD